MADTPEPAGNGGFGFLTHKLGPLPVYVWALLAVAGYYWYTHYGPGAAPAAGTAGTVVVDQAAQPIGGSQYKTNSEWEAAALNYLVDKRIPPTDASTALFDYLHSKRLTAQQDKDVNMAIEGIGPPPNIPAPAPVPPKAKAKLKPRGSRPVRNQPPGGQHPPHRRKG